MPFTPLISPKRRNHPTSNNNSEAMTSPSRGVVEEHRSFFSSEEDEEEDSEQVCWSSNSASHFHEVTSLLEDDAMEHSLDESGGAARFRTQSAVQRHSVFTLKRADFRGLEEDEELLKSIAFWLTSAGDRYVSEKNFVDDLADGVALCTVMSKIHGSGVNGFHKVAPKGGSKARDNWTLFRRACDRLCLPVAFSLSELRDRSHPDVVSTLVFLAHVCYSQGVELDSITDALQERIDELNDAMDESLDPMSIEDSAQTIEETLADMQSSMSRSAKALLKAQQSEEERTDPWYQSLARYISTIRDLRDALKRSRQENVNQIMERTMSFKNSLPAQIRSRLESLSENILHHADSLPDVIRSRLPIDTAKRLT